VGTELQQIYNSLINHRCPYESGVIIEGLRFAASWSPQAWTAIAGMAIALFAVVLGCFTVSQANSTRIAADKSYGRRCRRRRTRAILFHRGGE
jgi:hypothetical protein